VPTAHTRRRIATLIATATIPLAAAAAATIANRIC
jgi:hypothetical protein